MREQRRSNVNGNGCLTIHYTGLESEFLTCSKIKVFAT